jgi:hypothetical protein
MIEAAVPAHRTRQSNSAPARRSIVVNSFGEDLSQRLEDRVRHLKTYLAAAEQAAIEAASLVQQISREQRGEVEAHYNRLADAEEQLDDVRRELSRVMGELERALAPDEDD